MFIFLLLFQQKDKHTGKTKQNNNKKINIQVKQNNNKKINIQVKQNNNKKINIQVKQNKITTKR
jgi:hypothetical protein